MKHSHLILLCALLVLTAALYQPAWMGGLLWDDAAHLTRPELRSLAGLWRIWTDLGATQQYYPLTHSAFWLQSWIWGESTLGYHLVNIAAHATSAWVLWLILRHLQVPGALLAALLFAVHPVHVESVAWISELKNTLSALLYLGAAWFYLRFDEQRNRETYVIALLVFVAALLTKTVTASLPAALLVVAWWRRGTIGWRRDVRPLLPMFALGLAAGLLTAYVERNYIGAHGSEYDLTALERILLAARAVWFYLGKLVWPAGLSFVYPRWAIDQSVSWQYLPPLLLGGALLGAWLLRRRTRAPLAALLLFCVGLFPALGFVDVFPFRYSYVADHFQYHASIGMLAAGAAGLAWLGLRFGLSVTQQRVLSGVLLLPLAVLTLMQSSHYASAERLYQATLARNPGAWLAHNNLGRLRAREGRAAEALTHFREAVRLAPAVAEHHMNLGQLLVMQGEPDESEQHFREVIRLEPRNANAFSNLGVALLQQGALNDAAAAFQQALAIDPAHPQANLNLANMYQDAGVRQAQQSDLARALESFTAAARHAPGNANIRYNLGTALLALGRRAEAIQELQAAVQLQPNFEAAHSMLQRARGSPQ